MAGEMRLFTLEEANELIPRFSMIMERLQLSALALRRGASEVAAASSRDVTEISLPELLTQRPDLLPRAREIEALVAEIESTGAQFKGLDLGLVDFPNEREGEIILLCWQYGEAEISHWHPIDTGFAGRQPLGQKARTPSLQ